MAKKEIDYESDMFIDESQLDIECLEQADLMVLYGKNEALEEYYKELAKDELDLIKANLDKEIREFPERFDIDKITEPVVTATILRDKRYRKAYKKYLEAQYAHKVAIKATIACTQRKDMLETIVKLHGQNYFAGPKVPRDLKQERINRRKRNNERIKLNKD